MEKKVVIDLDEYLELKHMKKEIENGSIRLAFMCTNYPNVIQEIRYFTEIKFNQECVKNNQMLSEKIIIISDINKLYKQMLGELKFSSILKFIKWRKQNKKNPPYEFTSLKK